MRSSQVLGIVLHCLILAICFQSAAYPESKTKQDRYQLRVDDYGRRWEGIRETTLSPVTAEKIVLLSATTQLSDIVLKPSGKARLAFYCPSSATSEVHVFIDSLHYYMDPVNVKWNEGVNCFHWPLSVLKSANAKESELSVRILTIQNGVRKVYPALLGPIESGMTRSYVFQIVPLQRMDISFSIISVTDQHILSSGSLPSSPANVVVPLEWDCVHPKIVPEGRYTLILKGGYLTPFGVSRTVVTAYEFYHKPSFSRSELIVDEPLQN